MSSEQVVSEFVASTPYDALPGSSIRVIKQIVLAVIGTGLAGAEEDGCREVREYVSESGGRPEASVFFSDARVPARLAAFSNGVAFRALDYCDAMAPGLHMGSSIVPVALALAEKLGGTSGREFLCALAVGAEIGSRFNLSEAQYDGFDPTGVAGVFAATATACRMMRLSAEQTHNALALAFNRAGGSFQSNVDGSLAVRVIQGWVAETGILCAELAARGITGPKNFINGVYGYRKLFGRLTDVDAEIRDLGRLYLLESTVFKQFPSCGLTQGVTQLALEGVEKHGINAEDVDSIEVRVPPYAHKLVGHQFAVGTNPRVNAQFSIQFCVANALLRRSSSLAHFTPEQVNNEATKRFINCIEVRSDPELDQRGHASVDLDIRLRSGETICLAVDHPGGFPESPLSDEAHLRRFRDCVEYSRLSGAQARGDAIATAVDTLEECADVRRLIGSLVA